MAKFRKSLATVWSIQALLLICLTWESEGSSAGCNLILYDSPDLLGQPLVQITSNSLTDFSWNDRVSSIRVNGGCQWVLYDNSFNNDEDGSTAVIGPGPETYLNATFGIPDNSLTSVRRLPASGTMAILLFEYHKYYGSVLQLSSSTPRLSANQFDDLTSSFIITGGTWQLYSDNDYQGESATFGEGIYNKTYLEDSISNDALSSVRLVVVDIGFGNETYTVSEGQGSVMVCVRVMSGGLGRDVEVTLVTLDGSAVAGEEYQQLSVDLTFGEGSEKRCVQIELVNDTAFEGPEEFMVLLSTMEVGVTLSSDNATILIQDDDTVIVEFDPTSYTVSESDLFANIRVVKRGESTLAVSVEFTTANDSAISGEGYENTSRRVTFTPAVTSQVVMVPILNNNLFEGVKQFIAMLSETAGQRGVVLGAAIATVEIMYDDECNLTLYDSPDLSGQPLVHITNDSLANLNSTWNNTVSSIQVNGGCQWILYEGSFLSHGDDLNSSVLGPGPETYLNAALGIPSSSLSSVRCLPVSGTPAISLFEHNGYRGGVLQLNSSIPRLSANRFDDITSSLIITGGTWQLYSDNDYQGESATVGEGRYDIGYLRNTISNDGLSSVRLVGGIFTIEGRNYTSQNQQYNALYVYDQSRGSPAPFSFTCTSTQVALCDVRTTNELISFQSLIGTRVVDNVNITGMTSPVTLTFDPEFLPQFSGIYSCTGEGQEAVMITTENPFLHLNMGQVTLTGSADMFNITVMGAYSSGEVSLRPSPQNYRLVYFLGGEVVAVQGLVFVMDTSPYERVFLVDVGRNVQNGTNFNLTLSVSGLTTSVIFPVIVQNPAQLVLRSNQTNQIDAGSAISLTCVAYGVPIPSISWNNRSTLLRNGSRVTIYEELVTENGVTFVQSILQLCGAVEADTGQYSCFTNNTLGNDTASFDLTVSSILQDGACPQEVDTVFGIAWGNTAPGETSVQSCGEGRTGTARRFCQSDATWDLPDASQCESEDFRGLRTAAEAIFSNVTVVDNATVAEALMVVNDLAISTEPANTSILPRDLNTSNYIITNTVDLLILNLNQGGTTDIMRSVVVVGVIDNLLNRVNLAGFESLQEAAPASQSVLNNAERYALYLANASEQAIHLSRGNIVIRSERFNVTNEIQPSDVIFPQEEDLENFTRISGTSPAVITIPARLLVERSDSSTVPVANIQFQNLQDFLPSELNNSTATPASLIISSQVAGVNMGSQTLQENPVMITFTVEGATGMAFSCVFWNFSDPIGSGGWSTEGVTTVQVSQDGNNTVVQCNSTHLTSFAVLVNVAGSRAVVDSFALDLVTYIGLGISLTCLLLTIIFFLSFGKKLFKAVHNFVHLNLAIALFVGYLTFAIGVELAASNKAACTAVTAIMQYFFLASFCWMLCEGIMLYLMLVVVFSSLSKKWWWFFLILGWIPPMVFVVIGLTTGLDEYVVYLRNDTGAILTDAAGNDIISFCWLSSGHGTNAIWTFVAPMLAIVLINSVFLILVLASVFRNRGHHMSEMKQKGKRIDLVVTMVKASVILLPLLGLTWVLGLFAVNRNTLVFAWLFTIFNSLQGMLIFALHVLRSERVWGRIKEKYKSYSSTQSKAGDKGTASTSGGRKNGVSSQPVTNSGGGVSTLEMKYRADASIAYATEFEPTVNTLKGPINDDDVAAVVISESAISEERPTEEEVKNKSDPTSDEHTCNAVETTVGGLSNL